VQTLKPEVEVIFLNLRDLRFWSCDDYFATLTAAAQSNFEVVFYRDDVILVQKDQVGSTKLKSLLDNWTGCK
jgi:hypothetical protein